MEINILIDGKFEGCPDKNWFKRIAKKVLMAQGVEDKVELGLVITTQEKVHELNRAYRGKDRPTDVLAFYMNPSKGKGEFPASPDGVRRLGEVIISYPQAVVQANERGHSVKKELTILLIHGILHLLGCDHEKPDERKLMRSKEAQVLSVLAGELSGD